MERICNDENGILKVKEEEVMERRRIYFSPDITVFLFCYSMSNPKNNPINFDTLIKLVSSKLPEKRFSYIFVLTGHLRILELFIPLPNP